MTRRNSAVAAPICRRTGAALKLTARHVAISNTVRSILRLEMP